MTSKNVGMSLNMDENFIRPIIEAQVQAGIISALGERENILEDLARSVTVTMVDSRNGKPVTHGTYEYRNYGIPHVEYLSREVIAKVAKESVAAFVKEREGDIKAAIRRQLEDQGPELMAAAFVAGVTKAMESSWGFTTKVQFTSQDD